MSAKQRVGGPIVKTLYTFYKIFGYKSVYYSLYFVVLYYFLFASNVRKALKKYYLKLGIKFTNKIFFKHLFNYALTTSDRFISKANPEDYTFLYKDRKVLLEDVKNGALIVSNHFGGWATASNYFNVENVKINVVMNEAMIKNAKEFEELLNKKNQDCVKIIDISKGSLATSIAIGNALLENESVAFMGDRALNEKYEYCLDFFNEKAYFNKNPFLIAYKTNKPIIALFVILKNTREYELLYKRIQLDKTKKEDVAIDIAMKQYVKALTNILKEYPLQWFNFYDFWEKK